MPGSEVRAAQNVETLLEAVRALNPHDEQVQLKNRVRLAMHAAGYDQRLIVAILGTYGECEAVCEQEEVDIQTDPSRQLVNVFGKPLYVSKIIDPLNEFSFPLGDFKSVTELAVLLSEAYKVHHLKGGKPTLLPWGTESITPAMLNYALSTYPEPNTFQQVAGAIGTKPVWGPCLEFATLARTRWNVIQWMPNILTRLALRRSPAELLAHIEGYACQGKRKSRKALLAQQPQ